MSKPVDPGTPDERKKVWKRPTTKSGRDKLRTERIAEAKAVMPK